MDIKKLVLFVVVCIAFASCRRTTVKNDYDRLNLKGTIQCIAESYYSIEESGNDLSKGKRVESETTLFDNRSNEAFLSYESRICFDRKGRRTEVSVSDSAGRYMQVRETCEYDETGNLVLKKGYGFDSLYYREAFTYDTKNREIGRMYYDMDGSVGETSMTDYVNNEIISVVYFGDIKNAQAVKIHVILDGHGNHIEESASSMDSQSSKDGVLLERATKIFDNKGRIIEFTLYDSDNEAYQKSVCKYDDAGNESESTIYDLENNEIIAVYKYFYIYDEHGNWIEQVCFVNDVPDIITVREIKYYE
jgi:hypothetical protein